VDARLRAPWHPLEAVPIAIAAAVVTIVLVVVLNLVVPTGGSLLIVTGSAVQQVALAAITLGWVTFRYREALPALGLHSRRSVADGVIGAVAGVVLLLLMGFVVFPVERFLWEAVTGAPPGPIEQLPLEFTTPVIVGAAIVVIGITPPAEEIFFRGFLFGGLRGRLSFLPSAAIASAAFAVLHPPLHLMIIIFFVGFGLAALYEWRGSLVVNIAAHMAFNLLGYTVIVMNRT
jgi:membrane protease YdiL (CAAX protease family)